MESGPALDDAARSVARVYAAFAEDLLTGSRRSVSFSEALARRETVEAIGAAKSPPAPGRALHGGGP